jgi:C-methyltransferase C-terminal domain/Methyltransferase domain/Putative zinc binding domain
MRTRRSKARPTSLITRTTCRICGSPHLAPVLSLGDHHIAGAFADPGGSAPIQRRVPLELVRCDTGRDQEACGLLQTRHTVPGAILYRSYWYRSGINRTMTENLHGIAQRVQGLAELRPGDLVIDIGCNDGTLLDGYTVDDLQILGFDPSDVSRFAVEKGYDVVRDFFTGPAVHARYPDRKAKVITSIAMFYDLEDPLEFVEGIASCLAEDGVWVIELSYMPTMLAKNSFDTIVHEHLEYYSLAVLEWVLAEAGLEAIAAELNDINGGSIRLFIGHSGKRQPAPEDFAVLQELRVREFELALDSPEPYARFARESERVRDELRQLLERLRDEDKKVHIYGASTKGNTILQYINASTDLIEAAADRNPDKWGSETIGTGIPILSEEESRAMAPDYYLALPWHFLDEFVEREAEFLRRGGEFIVPLPEVHLVGAAGRRAVLDVLAAHG